MRALFRALRHFVEVDGVTHSSDAELAHDAKRTAFLEKQNYRVLRVWSLEVFTNMDGVMESMLLASQHSG